MSTNALLRAAVLSSAALCLSLFAVASVHAQDVGGGIGGGAGIFRAKNPETKKSASKPVAGAKLICSIPSFERISREQIASSSGETPVPALRKPAASSASPTAGLQI